MATQTATLEEFVENYIQNKAKSSTEQSYADWLRLNGINAEKIYSDSISDITVDYARAKSQYGANAEALARLGLNSSGYSDYLSGKAYGEMQKSKSNAKSKYVESTNKNAAGYEDYLSQYTKAENKIFESIVDEISGKGIIDFTQAYSYAIGAGLGEDAAKAAAKTGSDLSRTALKKSIVNTVITKQLTSGEAKEYALQLGLGEEEADEIAEFAKKTNEYVSYSGSYTNEDYLEILKDKAQAKTKSTINVIK